MALATLLPSACFLQAVMLHVAVVVEAQILRQPFPHAILQHPGVATDALLLLKVLTLEAGGEGQPLPVRLVHGPMQAIAGKKDRLPGLEVDLNGTQ